MTVSLSETGPRIIIMGHLTFGQWAAAFSRCAAVVTHDTGAIHLASAVNIPVVAVYDRQNFNLCSKQWAPWMVSHRILQFDRFGVSAAQIVEAVRNLIECD